MLCRFPTCHCKGLSMNRNTLECEERAEKERTNWWSSTRLTELMNLGFLLSWRKWCLTPGLSPRLSFMTLSSYYLCNKALLLVCNLLPSWWNLHCFMVYNKRREEIWKGLQVSSYTGGPVSPLLSQCGIEVIFPTPSKTLFIFSLVEKHIFIWLFGFKMVEAGIFHSSALCVEPHL